MWVVVLWVDLSCVMSCAPFWKSNFAQLSEYVEICEILDIKSTANFYGQRGEPKATNLCGLD
jgi:hypothetical protein